MLASTHATDLFRNGPHLFQILVIHDTHRKGTDFSDAGETFRRLFGRLGGQSQGIFLAAGFTSDEKTTIR